MSYKTLGQAAASVKIKIPEEGLKAIENRTGYPKSLLRKTEEKIEKR